MEYRRTIYVKSSLEEVRQFHAVSASMAAITPPPVVVKLHKAPRVLIDGEEMVFTLWVGFFPIRWHAKIENVSENGFDDRMLAGPFQSWIHHHRFYPQDSRTTMVEDTVRAEFRDDFPWKWIGRLMWINMPVLFKFRAWRTQQLLSKR